MKFRIHYIPLPLGDTKGYGVYASGEKGSQVRSNFSVNGKAVVGFNNASHRRQYLAYLQF